MADLKAFYRLRLQEVFAERKGKNARFSQNAFAKALGVNATYYSKLMSGKILISLEIAERITKKLRLSPDDRKWFLLSVAEEQRCHALYLIDPSLTECDPNEFEKNSKPKSRKKSR